MALTLIFALCAALVLALTLMPVLASMAFRKGVREHDTWIMRQIKTLYVPLLRTALAHPATVVTITTIVFLSSAALAFTMGAEFIPRLEEGTIAISAWRLPSVSLTDSVSSTTLIEKTLKVFPEIQTIVSRTGQAEIPTDPMGIEMTDVYVILKPPDRWPRGESKDDLISKIDRALRSNVPGHSFGYTQPIELRVQEIIAGARSDVAIKLFGEDLDVLKTKADEIVAAVSQVRGASETKAEQIAGLPYLRIRANRAEIARYGINASQVLDVVETLGGKSVGEVMEGQRRFGIQVRFQEDHRQNIDEIRDLKVSDPQGRLIPLSQLTNITLEQGPAQISRENVHRRIGVETNVRGRDLAGFVADARRTVEQKVKVPPGYWIEWGGQFDNLQRASARLAIVVPLALFFIFVMLYTTFNNVKLALLIFVNVPLAATGGILALYARGMPFSISAGMGFIALFGVAVMNGIVLVTHISDLHAQGLALAEAIVRGADEKLRAMIMAPAVAGLGFIPMAVSTSSGAEVQRPLATVVIGGLITSTLLTLLVIPAIYRWFTRERPEPEI